MLRAIIIDDEETAQDALEILLHKFVKEVEVIGKAGGVATGIQQIQNLEADIVFLDINMEDGTGFDLLDTLDHFDFHLVFVTAYNQYAIKAFKYAAFDYLLKPVDLQELRKCMERIKAYNDTHTTVNRYQQFKSVRERGINSKITLPNLSGFDLIEIKDIIRCEGQKNYTTFYLVNGRKIVVSKTLKEYELILTEHNFLRVFQSHLINLSFIKQYIKGRGGEVIMNDGATIPVSREKKGELLKKLGQL